MIVKPSKPNNVLTAFRLVARSVARHPWLTLIFLVGTLTQGTLQALLVWALRAALLMFSNTHVITFGISATAALLILAISLGQSASAFIAEMAAWRLSYRIQFEALEQLLAKVLVLPVRYFEKHGQGDLVMSSYSDLQGIRGATEEIGRAIVYITRLTGLAVVAWLISPKLATIGLVAIPLVAWPTYRLGQRITDAAGRERGAVASWHDTFLQVSSGIRIIKVNRAERPVIDKTHAISEEIFQHVIRKGQARGLARFMLEAVSGLGLIIVLVVGGGDVATGKLDWQSLLGLLIAVLAVYSPIVSLLQTYSTLRGILPNLDRVEQIMELPEAIPDRPDALPLRKAPAQIEFRDVSFAYDSQSVLNSISLTIHQGETIGVVGPSGVGKSTLMALLLRFYEPTNGAILFDDVDLRQICYADLMDQCAIVLQEPFLFADTIANNIRFARPAASMEEVVAAAQAANVHADIMAMEHGYATMLGNSEEGRGLSVGQKQRICIAAALLKNAPILFLDEATSNLDSVSERKVQDAIDHLMVGRTTVVIAHRLSTLRAADRIVVLDMGRVVGFGTHDELQRTCPTYQKLWRYQHAPKEQAAELADDGETTTIAQVTKGLAL